MNALIMSRLIYMKNDNEKRFDLSVFISVQVDRKRPWHGHVR